MSVERRALSSAKQPSRCVWSRALLLLGREPCSSAGLQLRPAAAGQSLRLGTRLRPTAAPRAAGHGRYRTASRASCSAAAPCIWPRRGACGPATCRCALRGCACVGPPTAKAARPAAAVHNVAGRPQRHSPDLVGSHSNARGLSGAAGRRAMHSCLLRRFWLQHPPTYWSPADSLLP